jgi:hypothetical protein
MLRGRRGRVKDHAGRPHGFTNFEFTLGGKWLGTLKEVAPQVTRVAFGQISVARFERTLSAPRRRVRTALAVLALMEGAWGL